MKAIMVMFDSLNRHMLPPYGGEMIHAPNFERLAERTVTFDKCYAGSMPCMPARRELHTGRYNFLHRSWGPLEPFDVSMPELLKQNGVYTHLTTDHQHYFEDGGGTYHTRYNTWEFSRGQEGDPWKGHVADPDMPDILHVRNPAMVRQDQINRSYYEYEMDQPQAVTFSNGIQFIQDNCEEDRWFLQIETFDPHEPFFTQKVYKDLYPHDYDGPQFDWPNYGRVTETPEQAQHVRYEYAALVSMCDAYLGRVLDMMDDLDMWDDTMLIVNTDHGFLLGEHDWWAKNRMPLFEEIIHTPLFIWDPRCKRHNERCDSLVQTIDLPATMLEFFGVPIPDTMQGLPLRDAIAVNAPVHGSILFGYHGAYVNVTDGRYVYMRAPASEDNMPLFNYTMMPTHMRGLFSIEELQQTELSRRFDFSQGCPMMKIPAQKADFGFEYGTLLFDLENDPQQKNPLEDADVEKRMIGYMVDLMKQSDAPDEQYIRMGLGSK